MPRRFRFVPVIVLVVSWSQLYAAPKTKPDFSKPQTFLHLADAFADEQDYYRAITEYKKVIFLFPDYEKLDWVHFQIGKMYYEGGRFPQAKHELLPLTESKDEKLRERVKADVSSKKQDATLVQRLLSRSS